MLNTALTTYVEFEWLVQPPPTIPCWRLSASDKVLLRFKIHGPWNPENQYEWLLFTVHFIPLGQFLPHPAVPLPQPHDEVEANGFTFIPHNKVRAGHDLVSFSDIIVDPGFPGFYQFQISAFIATQNKVRKQLLGYILSHPVHIQTSQDEVTNAIQLYELPLPKCPCCDESPCSCWRYCCHLPGCYFCQRCTPLLVWS